MEAEFVACLAVVQEEVWLKRFFDDIKIITIISRLVTINCDSQAAIFFTKYSKYRSKFKHIETNIILLEIL